MMTDVRCNIPADEDCLTVSDMSSLGNLPFQVGPQLLTSLSCSCLHSLL